MFQVLFILIALTAAQHPTATWYDFPGGGDSCRIHNFVSKSYGFDGGFCGAPSEGLFRSLGESGKCGAVSCSNRNDNCNYCCNSVAGPSCPYSNICKPETGQPAKFMCVRCAETAADVCKHKDWVRIGIADACPSVHPCNVCKGINPCAADRQNVDLCWGAWNNIFKFQVSDSVNKGGNKIDVSFDWKTNCPKPGRNGGGGGTSTCTDIAPPGNTYTCPQQASWGKCSEAWMSGYCKKSCGKCTAGIEDDSTAYIAEEVSTVSTSSFIEMSPTNVGLIVACSILLVAIVIVVVLLVRSW